MPEVNGYRPAPGSGSILVVLATGRALLPTSETAGKRISMGLAKTGGTGANFSGDLFIAFSTADSGPARRPGLLQAD